MEWRSIDSYLSMDIHHGCRGIHAAPEGAVAGLQGSLLLALQMARKDRLVGRTRHTKPRSSGESG